MGLGWMLTRGSPIRALSDSAEEFAVFSVPNRQLHPMQVLWGQAEENGENRKTPVAISMAHDHALIYRTLQCWCQVGKT
jgi:hypothetical protein